MLWHSNSPQQGPHSSQQESNKYLLFGSLCSATHGVFRKPAGVPQLNFCIHQKEMHSLVVLAEC